MIEPQGESLGQVLRRHLVHEIEIVIVRARDITRT
jgi:hypothetical protein